MKLRHVIKAVHPEMWFYGCLSTRHAVVLDPDSNSIRYRYYVGDNGLTLFNFGPTAFQNLMYQAAGESETLKFLGRDRTINSIVLLSNGISFAIQVVVFLILGAFADFGSWRPNILIGLSVCAFGIGFGWLGVHTEDKWHVGVGLYIVGLIAYQTTVTFWTAAFPGLARNTKELRDKAEDFQDGKITRTCFYDGLL